MSAAPDVPALTEAMRRLSDGDRRAAIAASPNVIGFGRFVPRPAPRS